MLDRGIAGTLWSISVWVIPVLLAIPLHEAAHGLAAYRLGDDTAYQRGRVTLNPLRHGDVGVGLEHGIVVAGVHDQR